MDFRYKSYRPYGPIQFITSITSTVNLVVNLPNGHKAVVTFIGTVQLTTTLSLQNVLCVPTFSFDLVSISQLTKNLTCLIFLDTLCFIQGLHPWRTAGLGKAKGNLYLLDTSINSFPSFSIPAFASNVSCVNKISAAAAMPANFSSFSSVKNKCQDVHLWHATLGHPSISRQLLLSHCIPQIAINNNENFTCTICPMAKQKMLPFPNTNHVSKNAFDLVHCDTWGPFSIPTTDDF